MSYPARLTDPTHPDVLEALQHRCIVCKARVGFWCQNPVTGEPRNGICIGRIER